MRNVILLLDVARMYDKTKTQLYDRITGTKEYINENGRRYGGVLRYPYHSTSASTFTNSETETLPIVKFNLKKFKFHISSSKSSHPHTNYVTVTSRSPIIFFQFNSRAFFFKKLTN